MSFILISNTSDNVINSNLIDFISEEIKKTNKADIYFKELSTNQAYECFLPPDELSDQLSKFINKLKIHYKLDINLNGKLVTAMTYVMVANYGIAPPSRKYFDVISDGYKNCSLDLDFLFEAKEHSIKADSGEGYESARWNN